MFTPPLPLPSEGRGMADALVKDPTPDPLPSGRGMADANEEDAANIPRPYEGQSPDSNGAIERGGVSREP